jgi:hypothetical protein
MNNSSFARLNRIKNSAIRKTNCYIKTNNPQFVNEISTLNFDPNQYGFLKKIKLKNNMNDIIANDMRCNRIFKTDY